MPGRIRIKFNLAIASDPQARELFKANTGLPPGVRSVRLNIPARSVVLEYDAERIPMELVEELITNEDDARAAHLLEELDTILKTIAKEVQ